MALTSVRKKHHSMSQPQTKVRIRIEVARGLINPMVNQIATPVTAPKSRLVSRKNRVCHCKYPSQC